MAFFLLAAAILWSGEEYKFSEQGTPFLFLIQDEITNVSTFSDCIKLWFVLPIIWSGFAYMWQLTIAYKSDDRLW